MPCARPTLKVFPMGLPKRRLGRTGLDVTEIALGGYFFPKKGEAGTYAGVIDRALELGINLVDTAPGYKDSEQVIGDALRGGKRDKVILSSKYYPYGNEDKLNTAGAALRATIEKSLKRLRTDRLDILHLHWVHGADDIRALLDSEVAKALLDLRKEGKVLHFAVSEASELDGTHTMLEAALPARFFESVMVTYNILLPNAENRVLPLARETETGVLVMMPLNQPQGGRSGLISAANACENVEHLINEGALPDTPAYRDKGLFGFMSSLPGTSFPQAALRFVLDRPEVTAAVAGTASVRHLADNASVPGLPPLPPAVHSRLRELFGSITKHVK